jgi:ATP-dependent DNA ligase
MVPCGSFPRNGHSFTNFFRPVPDALRGFLTPIVLDGEIMVIDDHGRPDFEALQQRLRPQDASFPDTAATWYLTGFTSTATRSSDAD